MYVRTSNIYDWTDQSNKSQVTGLPNKIKYNLVWTWMYAFFQIDIIMFKLTNTMSQLVRLGKKQLDEKQHEKKKKNAHTHTHTHLHKQNTFLFVSYVIIVISGLRWTHIATDIGNWPAVVLSKIAIQKITWCVTFQRARTRAHMCACTHVAVFMFIYDDASKCAFDFRNVNFHTRVTHYLHLVIFTGACSIRFCF